MRYGRDYGVRIVPNSTAPRRKSAFAAAKNDKLVGSKFNAYDCLDGRCGFGAALAAERQSSVGARRRHIVGIPRRRHGHGYNLTSDTRYFLARIFARKSARISVSHFATPTSSSTSSRGSSRECRPVVRLAIGITSGNRTCRTCRRGFSQGYPCRCRGIPAMATAAGATTSRNETHLASN